MESSGATDDASLSIRNSCNRCRAHKLKCTIQSESDGSNKAKACKRCARAMVDCVFSRRKKPKRCARDDPGGAGTHAAGALAPHPLSPDGSSTSIPTDWSPSSPTLTEDPRTWATEAVLATPVTAHAEDAFGVWAQPLPALTNGPLADTHQPVTIDEGFNFVAKYVEDNSMLDGLQPSVDMGIQIDPALSHTYQESPHSLVMVGTESPVTMAAVSERGSTTRALLRLASDLYERLEALRHGPWAGHGCDTFDDYPVGSVLHLSEEFARLATATPGGIDLGQLQQQARFGSAWFANYLNGTSSSSLHQDAPATLVLAACGVMLAQLFDVVLCHLQNHLQHHHGNMARSTTTEGEGPFTDPTVCLGDLPPSNASNSRTYTAIRMLLASLDKAERTLGLPPQASPFGGYMDHPLGFVGNSARWDHQAMGGSLSAPASFNSLQDAFTALRRRATEARDLLRTMMDL